MKQTEQLVAQEQTPRLTVHLHHEALTDEQRRSLGDTLYVELGPHTGLYSVWTDRGPERAAAAAESALEKVGAKDVTVLNVRQGWAGVVYEPVSQTA